MLAGGARLPKPRRSRHVEARWRRISRVEDTGIRAGVEGCAARRGAVGGVGWGVRFGVGVRTTTLGTSTSAWIAGGSTAMQTAEEEAEPELSEELLDAGVG
jgi:hypothetical protein